jgi:hypothetical protein
MIFIFLVPLVLAALPAQAYIGPGAGAGTIAVVLGILASIVMAFFAILWYPVKRMVKKRRSARLEQAQEGSPDTSGSTSDW